ncbi:MAG: hypothetical protein Q9198_001450 [Flavoplaca austrocitrina]
MGMTPVTQAGLIDQWKQMTNILHPGTWKNLVPTTTEILKLGEEQRRAYVAQEIRETILYENIAGEAIKQEADV